MEALNFESGIPALSAGKVKLLVADAMVYVKGKSKNKSKTKMFKKPGDVINNLPGAEGIKFHILGPPYDEDLSGIKKEEEEEEMYSLRKHAAFTGNQAFLNAVSSKAPGVTHTKSPFNEKYLSTGSEKTAFFKTYNSQQLKWRQIEEDWLESSDGLAIALNKYVNNTSLAMAIEFEDKGKVLLFPADAQSGNWMSWHNPEVSKRLVKNGGKTASDLLKKTVFYKVGHHGSHNGTASASGLDQMIDTRLIAMMPLVEKKIPSQWGGSKNFPAKKLYGKLIEKTNGAILRADEGLITDERARDLREKNLSATLINKLKKADKTIYQEWTIEV